MANKQQFDDGKLFNGFIWGLLVGGVVTFFNGPRIQLNGGTNQSGNKPGLQSLEQSIEEGKAAARQRKRQLQSHNS